MPDHQQYFTILYFWMALAVIAFFVLLKKTAPYGRHFRRTSGFTVPNHIGWMVMELPAVLVFGCFFLRGDPATTVANWLFFAGLAINWRSDAILMKLRDGKNYQIPYGGLFKLVSCPNYFGEIIEWLGFALMTWALPAFSFFLWTAANLVPRALAHHKWYQEKFEDYPLSRKAIIPFLL